MKKQKAVLVNCRYTVLHTGQLQEHLNDGWHVVSHQAVDSIISQPDGKSFGVCTSDIIYILEKETP